MPPETATLLDAQFKAIVKANDKIIATGKKAIASDYAQLLKDLKYVVGNAYESYAQQGSLSYTEMQRYNRIKTLQAELDKTTRTGTKPLFTKMRAGLEDVTVNSYSGSIIAINAIANSNIGPELSAGEINAILQRPWSGITLAERIGLRRSDIGTRVRAIVTQGIMQEASYEDTARALKDVITKDYMRTGKMAEDLAHQVQNDAFAQSFKDVAEEDIEITKTWVSAGDEKVREDHEALDGQTVLADEMFEIPSGPNKGMQADGPGLFGVPEEDYNCRCWFVAGVRKKD